MPQVKLLEVNVSPDLTSSTEVTARLVQPSVAALLPLLLGDMVPAVAEGKAEAALRWEKWHPAAVTSTAAAEAAASAASTPTLQTAAAADSSGLSVLQFARRKREGGMLRADYSPQKKHVADRVSASLKEGAKAAGKGGKEEEQDSEEEL